MLPRIDRPVRALAATALFGALILAVPSQAQTPPAQTRQAPAAQPTASPVETRVTELHDKLKITSAQEAKWKAVAQVMRDNAQKMDGLMQKRGQTLRTMTAVDDLKSYREMTDAHTKGLQKLIPAFETLYNAMAPDQRKNADQVFAKFQEPDTASGSGK
ncbi:MAG: Spy/CpxP family protein refolding chaperone [Proteobacteria bacterium]|nr:Spy/CpxP family protein refolding chaperone [Pseudomonadota bacterium]